MPLHTIDTTDRHGHPIRVEAHIGLGLPSFQMIGRPLGEERERRDRIRAAIINSGLEWPIRRITVNVAPALNRATSQGDAGLDFPIAVAVLAAAGHPDASQLSAAPRAELSLDGNLWEPTPPDQHCFREDNCSEHPRHVGANCCCCGWLPESHTGCDCPTQ